MPAEQKTTEHRVETKLSQRAKREFKRRCNRLNVSIAQRMRDLIQQDLKAAASGK
jgi:hypothetical protein